MMSENIPGAPILPKSVQWAVGWLFILCSIFIINALAILVGLRIFSFSLPVCVVMSLLGLYFLSGIETRSFPKRRLVFIGIAFLSSVVLLGYVVSLIWEYSNWGRGFYTDAIVQLAAGWNPIYDYAGEKSQLLVGSGKALWYLDASIYAFLGHYEMAKIHTLLFALPAFLLTRYAFIKLTGGTGHVATAAALLSLLNPVALSQVFSFYSDGVLAYAIQCFLALALLILNEGYLHGDLLIVLSFLWTFILQIPEGGFHSAVILGICFLLIVAVLYQRQALRWLIIRTVPVVFCGIVIIGFNPFIQNLVETGSVFCQVDIVSQYKPLVLEGKTWFGQFLYSMLASPDLASSNLNLLVQQLTAIINTAYAAPDVPLRGFGFLGGFLIIVAAFFFIAAVFSPRRHVTDDNAIYIDEDDLEEAEKVTDYIGRRTILLWLFLPVIITGLFATTLWWARTVAILWWLIPLAIVALSSRRSDGRSHAAKLLLMLAVLNCGLMAFSVVSTARHETIELQGFWQRMQSTELPTDEDAQLYNELASKFNLWNDLKGYGEEEIAQKAIWTKIEGLIK